MTTSPLSNQARIGLAVCLWLSGLLALVFLDFAFGGTMVELFKGMNLKLPMPTKFFMALTAPLRSGGVAYIIALLWSCAVYGLSTILKDREAISVIVGYLVIFSLIQLMAGMALVASFLPLYQLIGNIG